MSIPNAKLEFWAKNNYNVCLSGRHGVGKTGQIVQLFNELYGEQGKDWLYFSASTMDPWVDFIGVPKEATAADGVTYLHLVRPEVFARDQVKAIFLDEYNRAPKKIRNAVMELIQFQSINGHKFHNLSVVWTAINPPESEDSDIKYDVEELDEAQLDRYHVFYEVPYSVSSPYFRKKYGDDGVAAVEWWNSLPKQIKEKVSPRRLDYAVDFFTKGGDMRDVMPKGINVSQLAFMLSEGSIKGTLNDLLKDKDTAAAKAKLEDENFYNMSISIISGSAKYMRFFMPLIPDEKLSKFISSESKAKLDKMLAATKKSKVMAEKINDIILAKGIVNNKINQLTAWRDTNFPDVVKSNQAAVKFSNLLETAEDHMDDHWASTTANRLNDSKSLMNYVENCNIDVITRDQAKRFYIFMIKCIARSNAPTIKKLFNAGWLKAIGKVNKKHPFSDNKISVGGVYERGLNKLPKYLNETTLEDFLDDDATSIDEYIEDIL